MTATATRTVVNPPMGDLDAHALLAAQDALATRAQLAAAGISRSVPRHRARHGTWREVLPGVYLSTVAGPTAAQRLLAALLYGGDRAQLTGVDALRLYGFDRLPEDGYVRILLPHARQIRPAGFVRVLRTRRLEAHPATFGPLVVVSVARAVADTGRCLRWAAPGEVRRLVGQALHRRLTSVEELAEEIDHGPRQHSALLRDVLAAAPDIGRGVAGRTLAREARR